MDPVSNAMLGLVRVFAPPTAPPVTQIDASKPALTDLDLDRDRLKAIYADARVADVPQGKAARTQASNAQAAPEKPEQKQKAQEAQQAQQAQQVQAVEAAERVAVLDPLMATRMNAIYRDKLTLTAPALAHLEALSEPLPWV